MSSDTFELLDTADGAAFEDLYRIYSESIAVQEQKSRDQIAAMIGRPDYRVLLAKRSGRTVGFSILFAPPGEPFALLEYMAIREADRGGGIGAELFRRCLPDVPMLVEVDSDRSGDQAVNHRRILFYRRVGCRRIEGLSYLLPLPGPPAEMELMIYIPSTIDPIPKSTLEGWLKVIYRDVYGCPPDDPRIARMLEPVADPVRLS
jgi:GNAT superfamily N-acetyltransferase